jgi:hypothetical protein
MNLIFWLRLAFLIASKAFFAETLGWPFWNSRIVSDRLIVAFFAMWFWLLNGEMD